MWKMIVFFLVIPIAFGQPFPKIVVAPTPGVANEHPPFSAYAVQDVAGDYEYYHDLYMQNTERLEDDHFDRKINVLIGKKRSVIQLVFTHWLAGELFRLQEEHQKLEVDPRTIGLSHIARDLGSLTQLWEVKKYLMKDTKSGWVGDNFIHLEVYIAFIQLPGNRTRIYYQIAVDAQDRQTLQASSDEAKTGLENILRCKS